MKIKGVNFGGWLLMEGYILHGRNIAESYFKELFKKRYGARELAEFERLFRDNFIREQDFRNVADMGANAIRLPFNYRLIEKAPYRYSEEGLKYLQKALNYAQKYGIKIILDLHAACGAQNFDWHSDSSGKALLWESAENRKRTYALWEKVADTFKDHPALLGYDILNEPVIHEKGRLKLLKDFYKETIKRIKSVDPDHLIFLEGNIWSTQIDFLGDMLDDNVSISIHSYQPLNYTFNFTPFMKFPGAIGNEQWNDKKMHEYLLPYARFAQKHDIRMLVGEFGINWRGGFYGEGQWLDSILGVFDDYGFDYTYWTYKAAANSVFPDGLYQYIENSKFIKREGPEFGFETYLTLWPEEKSELADFWQTKQYTPNIALINILESHFKK